MSADYIPTTEEVREFVESTYQAAICRGEVPADLKRTGLAAFDRWLATVKAEAWDEAKREVASIPCWVNPESGLHGFDLGDGETGARMRVMEALANNPYRTKETP